VEVGHQHGDAHWTRARAGTALDDLLGEGMLWIDKQADEWEYWSPGFMIEAQEIFSPE
jgi:ESCRT-II complex subunit VPS22